MSKTTTVESLIEQLSKYPKGTLVFLGSDEELNTLYGDVTVEDIELQKSNGDGTFDACVLSGTNESIRYE